MVPGELDGILKKLKKDKIAEDVGEDSPSPMDVDALDRRIFILSTQRFFSALLKRLFLISVYILLTAVLLYGAFHLQHQQYLLNKCYESTKSIRGCF